MDKPIVPQGDDEGLLTKERRKEIIETWHLTVQPYLDGLNSIEAEEKLKELPDVYELLCKAQRELTRQERDKELTLAKAEAEGYASEMLLLQQDCIYLRQELPKLVAEKEQAIIAHYEQERLDRPRYKRIVGSGRSKGSGKALIPDEESFREEGRKSERGRIRDTILAEFLDDSGVECVSIPKQSLKKEGVRW